MKKPLQIITLSNPDFQELRQQLRPKYLVGRIEHEEHTEILYALPCFFIVQNAEGQEALSIRPCRSEAEARESAANYILNARAHGLLVNLDGLDSH